MFAPLRVLVHPRIVLEHILKFIEMVLKDEDDFEISEFYQPHEIFLKISNFLENDSGRGSCPSSFPSGNQVDGSPLVAMYEIKMGAAKNGKLPPKNGRGANVLLDDLEKNSQNMLWHVS